MTDHERLARLVILSERVSDEITALRNMLARREQLHQQQHSGGRPRGPKPPCGTEEGYQWHRHRDEDRDAECLAAHAAHERARTRAARCLQGGP